MSNNFYANRRRERAKIFEETDKLFDMLEKYLLKKEREKRVSMWDKLCEMVERQDERERREKEKREKEEMEETICYAVEGVPLRCNSEEEIENEEENFVIEEEAKEIDQITEDDEEKLEEEEEEFSNQISSSVLFLQDHMNLNQILINDPFLKEHGLNHAFSCYVEQLDSRTNPSEERENDDNMGMTLLSYVIQIKPIWIVFILMCFDPGIYDLKYNKLINLIGVQLFGEQLD